MLNLPEDKYRQLVDICIMHYEEGLTQQQISERVGVSRPQISRLLATARSAGIVKITVENPFSEEYQLQRALKEAYGLQDVSIVNAPDGEPSTVLQKMALLLSMQLDTHLKDNGTLGIMGGHNIYGISQFFSTTPRKNLSVVSLSGGSEKFGNQQANNSAHVFAQKFACPFYPVHAPLVVASSRVRDILCKEPEIAQAMERGDHASVALIGIGRVDESSAFFSPELFDKPILDKLRSRGAVAGIGGSFIDREGQVLNFSERDRVLAIPAERLKAIPTVIAIAFGPQKVEPIAAVLKGHWVNVLITTLNTAKALISLRK